MTQLLLTKIIIKLTITVYRIILSFGGTNFQYRKLAES